MKRLLSDFTPENYNLDLVIDRKTELISGEVAITGVPHKSKISLHALSLDIKKVIIEKCTKDCAFQQKNDILTITLPSDIKLDEKITVVITWQSKLNHNMQSCYLSTYQHSGTDERIAATQFESHYARECFPCIDEPAAKATFDLKITVADYENGDIVLANTELVSQEKNVFTFARTPRMSTYLLAWVIGKFHKVETKNKNGVKIATYATLNHPRSSLNFANETAARALEYYDERFGVKYPLKKLDQVALPDFEAGAMENWGLVTYRESMMLADENAALSTRQSVAVTVTHELSHQWFGNLVTMDWWDDLWLNESFASIMEYFCTDKLYPEFNVWEDYFTGYCMAALKRDAIPGVQAVQQAVKEPAEIATLFDGAIVYAKGARLILMLIRLMGEDKFHRGIRDYFTKYQYQNTVGDNLWEALQPYADFDVKKFMHKWIKQPGYPAISKVHLSEPAGNNVNIEKRFLLNGESDNTKWPIPDVFDDMSGHYLLNLTEAEFSAKLNSFETLTLEKRLRVLIDRLLLARTPAVSASSLLMLLPKFSAEKSPAVWNILISMINDLKIFCPPDSIHHQDYKKYLANVFSPRFSEISFTKLSDPNLTRLRDALIGIAIYVEDARVLKQLEKMYQKDLAALDTELRSAILIAKIKSNEKEIFPELLDFYTQSADPEIRADILYVIATFAREPENLNRLMKLLNEPEIVRPGDHIFLYIYLLRNHLTRKKVLRWLTENWNYVYQMTGEKSISDYPRYASAVINDTEENEIFHQHFDSLKNDPALSRTLVMAESEIDARLKLISTDAAGVHEKLAEMAGREEKNSRDPKLAKVAIVAGGIIEKDHKILLVQESKKKYYGQWNLPSGRVEAEESILSGAVREIHEETGLEVELSGLCEIAEVMDANAIVYTFTTRVTGGEISVDCREILNVKWFSLEEIEKMALERKLRDDNILAAIYNARNSQTAPLNIFHTIRKS